MGLLKVEFINHNLLTLLFRFYIFKNAGKWVYGATANNIWTFGDNEVNKLLIQYFVKYNLPNSWYLSSAPIITAN